MEHFLIAQIVLAASWFFYSKKFFIVEEDVRAIEKYLNDKFF